MNYFNKAEKTLKSCLKERLSITTATVVGFLIAGAVVNAEMITGKDSNETIAITKTENISVKNNKGELTFTGKFGKEETNWTGYGLQIQAGNNKIINKAEITSDYGINIFGGTNAQSSAKEVINDGKINATTAGVMQSLQSGYVDNFINRGEINVTTKDGKSVNKQVLGIALKGKTKFENEKTGKVIVKSTEEGIKGSDKTPESLVGLKLEEGVTGVNNGQVFVDSSATTEMKNTIGTYVSANNGASVDFVNNGEINVKGNGNIIGILITEPNGATDKEGTIAKVENGKTGKITVSGNKAVGVKLGAINGERNKIAKEFTNNGLIELAEGTTNGIGIQVQNGKATNNGTIALEIGSNGIDRKAETKNIAIKNEKGEAINTGKIKVTDKTADELKDFDINNLFDGAVANKGMLVDKDGNMVSQKTDVEISGDLTVDKVNGAGELGGAIVVNKDSTLTGGKESINVDSLNVAGSTVTIKNENEDGVTFKNTTLNIANKDKKVGKIVIGEASKGASLTITNGTVNGAEGNKESDIELTKGSSLTLNGTTVNGNIGTAVNSEDEVYVAGQQGATVKVSGKSSLNGAIKVANINIGTSADEPSLFSTEETPMVGRTNTFTLSSNSVIGKEATKEGAEETAQGVSSTIKIEKDGQLVLEVGAKGETALGNSTGVTVTGTVATPGREDGSKISIANDANGDILLSTGNLTGTGISVDLGSGNTFANTSVSMENGNNGVYKATDGTGEGENVTIKLEYNKELFKGNGVINAINNGAMNANNLFENSNLAVREQQMKNIYEGSIYSETVRASYDSAKTFENVLRGMNTVSETGKWTAFGSGVYNKNSYDRAGHDSEIETTGLLAGVEYGLDANTSVGFAFAGANQDVDSLTGSADGTALYLGTYAKKVVGNYKFMAGLGYQYGDYDADNVTGYAQSSDSYNSNTLSAFVEGRYSMSLGNGIAFEPKLKLGYTYVDQDDTRDANFGVSDASLSTFDTELGADLIKTYALKDGKTNLVLGVSYVRAMGDTDKEFTGDFTKSNGGFAIKGAQLSENTGKFDLSLEVSKDSGFFYNGGVNLQVGSDDYRNYGVNFGAGYKF